MSEASVLFPREHPAFAGHFPGDPVVPGALLLAEALLAAGREPLEPWRLRSVKFLSPVRPGERVAVAVSDAGAGSMRLACAVDGRPVMRAEVTCDARSKPD